MNSTPREAIEWCDIWIRSADRDGLPRLLCIGDSIARGYYPTVERSLDRRFDCARIATSRFAGDPVFSRELRLVLDEYRFSVIHFNNGLHGWAWSEAAYREGMLTLVAVLREFQPQARLICATSTPIYRPGEPGVLATDNDRVVERNRIVRGLMADAGIAIDDLYAIALAQPSWIAVDGIHYGEAGCDGLANAVCMSIA